MSVSPCRVSLRAAHTDDHAHVIRRVRARAIGLHVTTAARLRNGARGHHRLGGRAAPVSAMRTHGRRVMRPPPASAPLRRGSALGRVPRWKGCSGERRAKSGWLIRHWDPTMPSVCTGASRSKRTFSCAVCSARTLAFGRRRFPAPAQFPRSRRSTPCIPSGR
jgi:hypothetical protein